MNGNDEVVILKEKIKSFLTGLSDIERQVLELRFGINDNIPKTLQEVSEAINISREEVREIENKALKTIKERNKK